MEIALEASIPSYSGGLGILAGDTLRAAADLGFPMVGVTLLYRKGYFRQSLNATGIQSERPEQWNPSEKLKYVGPLSTVTIEGRQVRVAAWRYQVQGVSGHEVPVQLDEKFFTIGFARRAAVYGRIMRFCIALNGGFFNTQRMLSQYISNAYSADCWGQWPVRIENISVPPGGKGTG